MTFQSSAQRHNKPNLPNEVKTTLRAMHYSKNDNDLCTCFDQRTWGKKLDLKHEDYIYAQYIFQIL